MQQHFYRLTSVLDEICLPSECFTCHFRGEDSDFVRFNRNRIRQAGAVHQVELDLDLIEGGRHVRGEIGLTGDPDQDCEALTQFVLELRRQRREVQDDPHLLLATEVHSTHDRTPVNLPPAQEMVPDIIDAAEGLDLVGMLVSGPIYRGFANRFNQTNWYETASFHLSWSCCSNADKAVKGSYGGIEWDKAELQHKLAEVRTHLHIMARPSIDLKPADYRVYLTPAALNEILSMVSWGGFSLKSHRTLTTPLLKMVREGRTLNSAVTLSENNAQGTAPHFTAEGYLKPQAVTLISAGEYRDSLVGPRSAKEFGQTVNAGEEHPESLDMTAGDLPRAEILERLDTGLYLGNLWYLNFSDRNDCRITGMTRFACFYVEEGKIRAPVNVMRFDDSIYRMLGDQLLGLTCEREFMPDENTYGRRSTASVRLPGALISKLTLTL